MDWNALEARIEQLVEEPRLGLISTYTYAFEITTESREEDVKLCKGISKGELVASIIRAEFEPKDQES